jgi:hypothetical protein
MTDLTSPKWRKFTDGVLIVLFALSISLPLVTTIIDFDPFPPINENRDLATWPKFGNLTILPIYLKNIELYYNDHFGYRQALIQGRALLMVKILGVSSNPEVILGKDGWLFLGSTGTLDYFRASTPFRSQELERWQQMLENNRDMLAEQGIRYLIIIAPNKDTIYPEYMPDKITRVHNDTRMDQLLAHLREHSDIEILDLRKPLKAAKLQEELYYKTDTHWNDLGAFIAYQQIIKQLAIWYPQFQPLPKSDFETRIMKEKGEFDLTLLLGLGNFIQEDTVQMRPLDASAYPIDSNIPFVPTNLKAGQQPSAWETGNGSLPRAVIFHDSFVAGHLQSFLSEHFSRTAFYHWQYRTQYEGTLAILEREQPDVVIHEFVERFLQGKQGYTSVNLEQIEPIVDKLEE